SQVVDEWVRVTDKESFTTARRIARTEGLLIGGSCGTCAVAALKYAERCKPSDLMVVIFPDTGRNYLSRFYNDDWMRENGDLEEARRPATVADVLAVLGQRELFTLSPDDAAQSAIDLLRQHAISQVPIVENGKIVGGIQEVTLARLLHEG